MMKKLLLLAGASALLLAPNTAEAVLVYSWNASTCTVDEVDQAEYQVVSGKIGFAGTTTGTVTVQCPIPMESDGATIESVGITYRDSTGPSNSAGKITWRVRKVHITNGGYSDLGIDYDGDTEGNCPDSGASTYKECQIFIVDNLETLDFGTYYYFIELQVHRNSSAQDVKVAGFRMFDGN